MPPPLEFGSEASVQWPWDPNPSRSRCRHPSPGSTSKRAFGQRSRPPYTRNSQKGLPCACSLTHKKQTDRVGSGHNTEGVARWEYCLCLPLFPRFLFPPPVVLGWPPSYPCSRPVSCLYYRYKHFAGSLACLSGGGAVGRRILVSLQRRENRP